jgi:hypothetical protein
MVIREDQPAMTRQPTRMKRPATRTSSPTPRLNSTVHPTKAASESANIPMITARLRPVFLITDVTGSSSV